MELHCPRCGAQVDVLVSVETLEFHYKGPLTRVCTSCRDRMVAAGDFVPSGTAERVVRAKRITEKQLREMNAIRLRQWLVRGAVGLVGAAAGYWAWQRFVR